MEVGSCLGHFGSIWKWGYHKIAIFSGWCLTLLAFLGYEAVRIYGENTLELKGMPLGKTPEYVQVTRAGVSRGCLEQCWMILFVFCLCFFFCVILLYSLLQLYSKLQSAMRLNSPWESSSGKTSRICQTMSNWLTHRKNETNISGWTEIKKATYTILYPYLCGWFCGSG